MTVGASAAAENLTSDTVRISGRINWAACSFMKAVSWASVGAAGCGTVFGSRMK